MLPILNILRVKGWETKSGEGWRPIGEERVGVGELSGEHLCTPLSPQDNSGVGGGQPAGPRDSELSACEISLPTCGPEMAEPLQANARRDEPVTFTDTLWGTCHGPHPSTPLQCFALGRIPGRGWTRGFQGLRSDLLPTGGIRGRYNFRKTELQHFLHA